jgi:quinol monooxygenase YgiN
MYVNLSVMRPNPGHEAATVDSMHRFAAAARTQDGLILCSTFRDPDSTALYGLAVWDSEQASAAARAALMAAVQDDDFDTWVADMENHHLTEV